MGKEDEGERVVNTFGLSPESGKSARHTTKRQREMEGEMSERKNRTEETKINQRVNRTGERRTKNRFQPTLRPQEHPTNHSEL